MNCDNRIDFMEQKQWVSEKLGNKLDLQKIKDCGEYY